MKRILHSIVLSATFGIVCLGFTGCKHTPPPPTEQDAVDVWKNTHKTLHTQELIKLTKTNGQMEEVNGVEVYTLYYQAQVKDVVKLGNREPGTVETYSSNYPFQWTEKGWMGPDNQLYPAQ
jgi:hypothetical protein